MVRRAARGPRGYRVSDLNSRACRPPVYINATLVLVLAGGDKRDWLCTKIEEE